MKNYTTAAKESPNVPIIDKMTLERILSIAKIYPSTMPLVNYAAFMLLRQYEGLNDDAEKKANIDELDEYAAKMFPIEIINNTFTIKDGLTPRVSIKEYTKTNEYFTLSQMGVKKYTLYMAQTNILWRILNSSSKDSQPIMDEVVEFQRNYESIPKITQTLNGNDNIGNYCSLFYDFIKDAYKMVKKDKMIDWQGDKPKIPSGVLTCATHSYYKSSYIYMRLDARRIAQITNEGIDIIRHREDQNETFAAMSTTFYFTTASAADVESTLRSCQKFLGNAFSSLRILAEMGERVKNEFLEYQESQKQ